MPPASDSQFAENERPIQASAEVVQHLIERADEWVRRFYDGKVLEWSDDYREEVRRMNRRLAPADASRDFLRGMIFTGGMALDAIAGEYQAINPENVIALRHVLDTAVLALTTTADGALQRLHEEDSDSWVPDAI